MNMLSRGNNSVGKNTCHPSVRIRVQVPGTHMQAKYKPCTSVIPALLLEDGRQRQGNPREPTGWLVSHTQRLPQSGRKKNQYLRLFSDLHKHITTGIHLYSHTNTLTHLRTFTNVMHTCACHILIYTPYKQACLKCCTNSLRP